MEADVHPVGRASQRLKRPLRVVADDECGAVVTKQLFHLRNEPACVPELEAVPSGRQLFQGGGEPPIVAVERLGELPEDRAELFGSDERLDALQETRTAVREVPQPLHVREISTRLYGEHEASWGALHPGRRSFSRREPVEAGVQLDRVERSRIVLEPARSGEAGRVEDSPPVLVIPARAADARVAHRSSRCHSVWVDFAGALG